jgi:hypothetical protein
MDITTASEEVTISRKKLYCFARLYQSIETTGSPFTGCSVCRLQCDKSSGYSSLKKYFRERTGISLNILKQQHFTTF